MRGAVLGLGAAARATCAAADDGLVPPDVLVGCCLFLLASQPRTPRPGGRERPGAVAGGVWVREQVTFHRPVRLGQLLVVSGETAQRYVKRGRTYGVNVAETRDADGRRLVSNRTTGLLRFRRDASAPDAHDGRADDDLPPCGPDPEAAADNPALDRLAALKPGDRIAGDRAVVTLEMMRARDGGRDENPIHTDPDIARREGLAAPIAGGSHVLSFLLEALMREWGHRALLHGAHLDARFTGQTYAGTAIEPLAHVVRVDDRGVLLELTISGEERTAMTGTLEIPFPRA